MSIANDSSGKWFGGGKPIAAPSPVSAQRGFGRPEIAFIANSAIALAAFLGGFVSFEPAPYELFLSLLLLIWVAFGMRIDRSIMPLLVLFLVFCVGGLISSFMIEDWRRGVIYVLVTLFLCLSSVFFATVVLEDMSRLRIIFRAYVIGALITSILGIVGYFGVPGFGMFTRYSRAMGAFQDPNVYGPFLAAPILYLIYGIVNRSPSLLPVRAGILMVLLLGLFLAFSRAAWGLAVVTAILFYVLLIINEQKAKVRLKYIVLAGVGALAIVMLLGFALQLDAVQDLFSQRVKAVQDYDGGREGRFARHYYGFLLATEKPLGIGPLEFGYIFKEDTHNMYLKALMDYGWAGFVAWMTMVIWTVAGGFKLLFRQRPWLPYLQIAYVVFVGHLLVGIVIDTDKWRHFYMMIGLIWGCMALEHRWQRQRRPGILSSAPQPGTGPAPRS